VIEKKREPIIINNHHEIYLGGTFKGRGRRYLSLLVCPVDGASLVFEDDTVVCTSADVHRYPFDDGILRLVSPADRQRLDEVSAAHEAHGTTSGWQSPDEGAFKSLPQTGLPGYPYDYWARQASATALLWHFLEAIRRNKGGLPVGPVGDAVIIGAEMGWLAYGLDVAGYTAVALDARAGSLFGLGVYPIARYLRVQADPSDPPLAAAAYDLLIYQDGLGTEAEHTLTNGLRVLRPGGWVAVMDAVEDTEKMLSQAGLYLAESPVQRRGWRGRLASLRDRLGGHETVPPPVIVAQKP
jgi:uncharacterized protein YbaR (Trm112 family)